MRLLVLGGSHFAGRAISEGLVADGHSVSVLNRGSRPIAGAEQIVANRDDAGAVHAVLASRSFDHVIDTSAFTGAHVRGALAALGSRFDNWLHVSSASIYQANARWPMREDHPRGGEAQWGAYATGKLEAEREIEHAAAAGQGAFTILRPPYLYGTRSAGDYDREQWLWARILRGCAVLVPAGDATQLQFLHNDDLVALVRVLLAGSTPRGVRAWNVARHEAFSARDYVRALAAAAGREAKLVAVDIAGLGVPARSFFPYRDYACVLDASAIERSLQWRPPTSLRDGLARTIAAYRLDELAARFPDHAAEDALLARISART